MKCVIEPFPQIAVSKKFPAQQGQKIGQRPTYAGFELQALEQQHGDQCWPNLDVQCILAGADKAFYLQILFEGLEKQLYLPSVLADCADCSSTGLHAVGQQNDIAALFFILKNHKPQRIGTIFFAWLDVNSMIWSARMFR